MLLSLHRQRLGQTRTYLDNAMMPFVSPEIAMAPATALNSATGMQSLCSHARENGDVAHVQLPLHTSMLSSHAATHVPLSTPKAPTGLLPTDIGEFTMYVVVLVTNHSNTSYTVPHS